MLKALVIGYLGKDAQVNNVNGHTVINFSVAHTEKYKDASQNLIEKTTWVDCSYWTDKTAVAPYLQKGTLVYCEGAPEARSFVRADKSAGAALAMRVHNVHLLGGKREPVAAGSPTQAGYNPVYNSMSGDDGVPF